MNISTFKTKVTNSAARANLFEVVLSGTLIQNYTALKSGDTAGENFKFLCSATSLPGVSLGEASLSYFGRPVYFPGDMTFGTWTTSIINDEDFSIRKAIEQWMDDINSHEGNIRSVGNLGLDDLTCSATISTFDVAGGTIESYTLNDCWPSTISDIALSHGTSNQIEQFDVTWQFNYMTKVKPDEAPTA